MELENMFGSTDEILDNSTINSVLASRTASWMLSNGIESWQTGDNVSVQKLFSIQYICSSLIWLNFQIL